MRARGHTLAEATVAHWSDLRIRDSAHESKRNGRHSAGVTPPRSQCRWCWSQTPRTAAPRSSASKQRAPRRAPVAARGWSSSARHRGLSRAPVRTNETPSARHLPVDTRRRNSPTPSTTAVIRVRRRGPARSPPRRLRARGRPGDWPRSGGRSRRVTACVAVAPPGCRCRPHQ